MAFPIRVALAAFCFSSAQARSYEDIPTGRFWAAGVSSPSTPSFSAAMPPLNSDSAATWNSRTQEPYGTPVAPLNMQPQAGTPSWAAQATYSGAYMQPDSLSVMPQALPPAPQLSLAPPQTQLSSPPLRSSELDHSVDDPAMAADGIELATPHVQPTSLSATNQALPLATQSSIAQPQRSSELDHSLEDPAMTSDGIEPVQAHVLAPVKTPELDNTIDDPGMAVDGLMGSQGTSPTFIGASHGPPESSIIPQKIGSQSDPVLTHLDNVVHGLQAWHNKVRPAEVLQDGGRPAERESVIPSPSRFWGSQPARPSSAGSVLGAPLSLEPMGPPVTMTQPDAPRLTSVFSTPSAVQSAPSNLGNNYDQKKLSGPSSFMFDAPPAAKPVGTRSRTPQPDARLARDVSPRLDALPSFKLPVRENVQGIVMRSNPVLPSPSALKSEASVSPPAVAASPRGKGPGATSSQVVLPASSAPSATVGHTVQQENPTLPPQLAAQNVTQSAEAKVSSRAVSPLQHLEEMYAAAENEIAVLKKQQQERHQTSLAVNATTPQSSANAVKASHDDASRTLSAIAPPPQNAEAPPDAAVEAGHATPAPRHALRGVASKASGKSEDRVLLAALQGDVVVDDAPPSDDPAPPTMPAHASRSPTTMVTKAVAQPAKPSSLSKTAKAVADMLHQLAGESGEFDVAKQRSRVKAWEEGKPPTIGMVTTAATKGSSQKRSSELTADASLLQQFDLVD